MPIVNVGNFPPTLSVWVLSFGQKYAEQRPVFSAGSASNFSAKNKEPGNASAL